MFDFNGKNDYILKLFNSRNEGYIVIPLYVNVGNKRYGILELDEIKDSYAPSSFKVGFVSIISKFKKESFPSNKLSSFDIPYCFTTHDPVYDSDDRIIVIETSYLDEDDNVSNQINEYISMLDEYVSNNVEKIRKEIMSQAMENN